MVLRSTRAVLGANVAAGVDSQTFVRRYAPDEDP